jgi:hypothetical protein
MRRVRRGRGRGRDPKRRTIGGRACGGPVADHRPSGVTAGQSKPWANSPPAPPAQSALWRREIPLRMAVTVLLVSSLSAGASRLGPMLGGMLVALPVLASVLAVFTHREHGAAALIALLRGMLAGMAGFVAFCEIVAALIVHDGIVPAFAAATVATMIVQMITAYAPGSRPSLEPASPTDSRSRFAGLRFTRGQRLGRAVDARARSTGSMTTRRRHGRRPSIAASAMPTATSTSRSESQSKLVSGGVSRAEIGWSS